MRYAPDPFKVTDLGSSLRQSIEGEERVQKQTRMLALERLAEKTEKSQHQAAQNLPPASSLPEVPVDAQCRLLALPAELLALIIEAAVTDPLGCGFTINLAHSTRSAGPSPCGRGTPSKPFRLHLPGQTRRKKALSAFKCLRATCRQIRDETDNIFFLQNRFDVILTRSASLLCVEVPPPEAVWYLARLKNLIVPSKTIGLSGSHSRVLVEVRLRSVVGEWIVDCVPKHLFLPEVQHGSDWCTAEKVSRLVEQGVRLLLHEKGLDMGLTFGDLTLIKTVVKVAEDKIIGDRAHLTLPEADIDWRRELWAYNKNETKH